MTTLRPATRRRSPYATAAGAGAALLADVAFDPAHRHVPLCPFHSSTGGWCPLCGGLRAANALAHLQVRAAVHDNAVFVLALPVLALWWIDWARRSRAGRPPRRLGRAGVVAIVLVGVAFTIVRNLPFAGALRPL